MLKIQLCHHRNKLHFKIYSNRNRLFEIVIIFHNISVFTVINKCSLGEHKRHLTNLLVFILSAIYLFIGHDMEKKLFAYLCWPEFFEIYHPQPALILFGSSDCNSLFHGSLTYYSSVANLVETSVLKKCLSSLLGLNEHK